MDGTHRVTDDRGTITNTKLDATKTKVVSKEVVGNLERGGVILVMPFLGLYSVDNGMGF